MNRRRLLGATALAFLLALSMAAGGANARGTTASRKKENHPEYVAGKTPRRLR